MSVRVVFGMIMIANNEMIRQRRFSTFKQNSTYQFILMNHIDKNTWKNNAFMLKEKNGKKKITYFDA